MNNKGSRTSLHEGVFYNKCAYEKHLLSAFFLERFPSMCYECFPGNDVLCMMTFKHDCLNEYMYVAILFFPYYVCRSHTE